MTTTTTATERYDVGQQRASADSNRCWGDGCHKPQTPPQAIHNHALGLCRDCHNDIVGPTTNPTPPNPHLTR